jgi:hypothetical protein
VYYLGVIDILTPYSIVKRIEHLWKGMSADRVCRAFHVLPCARVEFFVAIYSTRSARCRRRNMRTASSRLCARSCVVEVAGRGLRQSDDANRRHLTLSAANPPPRLISLSFSFKFP